MKTIYALIAGGLAVIAATPAFAQSAGGAETPAQAFSGATVEATFGWDHLGDKSIKDINQSAYSRGSGDGITYGGAVGYDVPVTTNVTVGGEVGLYDNTGRWTNDNGANTFNTASVKPGRDVFVGGRVGYALSPKTELFGKAGYSNMRFGIRGDDGVEAIHEDKNASGYRLGAGAEQKLTRMTYVKLEYDYSHYGTGQFDYHGLSPDGSNFDVRSNQSQILGSVGLRF